MDELAAGKCLVSTEQDSCQLSRYGTASLFGDARGKMFGVMVAQDRSGGEHIIRAFSGQFRGRWIVPGWAGPLFDRAAYRALHDPQETRIKLLGTKILDAVPGSAEYQALVKKRKALSQQLMQQLHALYRLNNFKGEEAGLADIFLPGQGIPTGTGDCCAPKLIHHAIRHDLKPLGIVEFFWGRENASGTRQHGCLYSSCRAKCYPLLGFMLCGLG